MDKLVKIELAECSDAFLQTFEQPDKQRLEAPVDDLASKLAAARQLTAVVTDLRDATWRGPLTSSQAKGLLAQFERLRAVLLQALSAAADLDVQGALSKVRDEVHQGLEDGSTVQTMRAKVVATFLLALEVAALYGTLGSCFGSPPTLIVEELSSAVVRCLRQSLRFLVLPMLSPPVEGTPGQSSKRSKPAPEALELWPHDDEETQKICSATTSALFAMHEFLCRHRLADEHLHQLVHATLGIFFTTKPDFPLSLAAEEVLVTIFSRWQVMRSSIIQEILVRSPKLQSGRHGRSFILPVSEDSIDFGLSPFTRLLVRLCQSTCLPLQETPGSEVDFSTLVDCRTSAQASISQLASGLLQRLLLQPGGAPLGEGLEGPSRTIRAGSRDEEPRILLEEIVDQLLLAAFRPPLPGALTLLRVTLLHLLQIIQPKQKGADAFIRESAVKLVGKITASLWRLHRNVKKGLVKLPAWNVKATDQNKDERRLQHIALKVSLEQSTDLPWTAAAKASEAWNAELHVEEGSEEARGLALLTDDLVFMYLTLAHLEDERGTSARFAPASISDPGSAPSLGSAIFASAHPVHAWSFLVCEWAEVAMAAGQSKSGASAEGSQSQGTAGEDSQPSKKRKVTKKGGKHSDSLLTATHEEVLERFLSKAWATRGMLTGEGSSWRSAGGRRVLLAFTVYKVYRQLRDSEMDSLRQLCLDCILRQANSGQASLRRAAMRVLTDLVAMDPEVLTSKLVEDTVDMRLRDESSWVRQVSLDLLGRALERGLQGSEGATLALGVIEERSGTQTPNLATDPQSRAMLLRFQETVRGRINDTSVIVRRQACKILSAFLLQHPDHPDVVGVAHDLMRRSTDSDALRNLVLGTFELMWFMEEEPTARSALQLARVVDAASSMGMGPKKMLSELLRRFRANVCSRKRSKGYDFALRRWTSLLLQEFVNPTIMGPPPPGTPATSALPPTPRSMAGEVGVGVGGGVSQSQLDAVASRTSIEDLMILHRRAILSTLEAFSEAEPEAMVPHLRPLTVYLALEDKSSPEEQWVALKVCRILSATLPQLSAERRSSVDHRQLQTDLEALVRSQPSSGVHEAIRCLCLVVKYISGDLKLVLGYLNTGIPSVTRLAGALETGEVQFDRINVMYISRQVWILASILESLSIDEYLKFESGGPPMAVKQDPRRVVPRSMLRFELASQSVATTVADLFVRLYEMDQPQLQAAIVACLGFFLAGQRTFVKDPRLADIISGALASKDLTLVLKALETLARLLAHFSQEAEIETEQPGVDDISAVHLNAKLRPGRLSAVEASQPLSLFGDAALARLSLHAGNASAACRDVLIKLRTEAFQVVRLLNVQGLVNPLIVLPKVFSLIFAEEAVIAEPALAMLKDMLELKPTLLLNRMDECLQEAFLAHRAVEGAKQPRLGNSLLPSATGALGELYVERFRKQKGSRETFIRRALREVFRLHVDRGHERFVELCAAMSTGPRESLASGRSGSLVKKEGETPGDNRKKRTRLMAAAVVKAEGESEQASSGGTTPDSDPALTSLSMKQLHQVLYAQFVACGICSLTFVFESEPLFLVYECNQNLSLQAGSFLTSPGAAPASEAVVEQEEPKDLFAEAIAITVCLLLKRAMKAAYALSDDQCARFDPKNAKQERLKLVSTPVGVRMSGMEEAPQRAVWPGEEFRKLAAPLAAAAGEPQKLAALVQKLTEDDAYDSSRGRYASNLASLEAKKNGKRPRGPPPAPAAASGPSGPSGASGPSGPSGPAPWPGAEGGIAAALSASGKTRKGRGRGRGSKGGGAAAYAAAASTGKGTATAAPAAGAPGAAPVSAAASASASASASGAAASAAAAAAAAAASAASAAASAGSASASAAKKLAADLDAEEESFSEADPPQEAEQDDDDEEDMDDDEECEDID